jgi:hypothetical protein
MLTKVIPDSKIITITTATIAGIFNKIIAVGGFTGVRLQTRNRIFVTDNSTGAEDTTFHTNMGAAFDNVTIVAKAMPSARVAIGGIFSNYNGTTSNNFIILNSNGTVNLSFGTKFNGGVEAIYVHPDGSMLIGGNFTSFDGVSANRIIKLTPQGYIDGSFNSGTGFDSGTRDISFDGTYYYITGPFTAYQGISSKGIVKMDAFGNLIQWGNFTCNFTYYNKLDGNGNLYVGGDGMTDYNGTSIAPNLTKLNTSDLSLNTTFSNNLSGGFNGRVANFSVHNGNIYVSGSFNNVAGVTKTALAKISTNGVLDTSFPVDSPNTNTRFATLVNNNTFLAIGGSFVDFAGSSTRDRFAVVDLAGAVITGWNRDFYGGSQDLYNVCEAV